MFAQSRSPILTAGLGFIGLFVLFIACRLMIESSTANFDLRDTLVLLILITILNCSRKTFYFIVVPLTLIYALYSPIGLIFGPPTYHYIASLLATDLVESKEFLQQIPVTYFLYPFAIIALMSLFRVITVKFHIAYFRNRALLCTFIIFLLLTESPTVFIGSFIHSFANVKQEIDVLSRGSSWGESTLNDQSVYDDYVLVIGESARRDYHHAYGYPIENTKFMSSANGVLIDGLAAGGTGTVDSLRLMLTQPNKTDWRPNYDLSIIDLVKSAGIKTYWLSNQGYIGAYDTPITSIAIKSDEKVFLKQLKYNFKNTSDFELLPEFEKVIKSAPQGKRFIVLHLYGSHFNACDRIADYPKLLEVTDKKYQYLSCYISSLQKTDDFLKSVYDLLAKNYQQQNRRFSMIYFADHGLAHKELNGELLFTNSSNTISKLQYNVPLFKVSSDDTHRAVYKVFKSGLNFTDGLATWIGIDNAKLNKGVDLFTNQNDENDFGLQEKINNLTMASDPAIDIRNH